MLTKINFRFVKMIALIIALTAIVYYGTLNNSFVGDDAAIIVNNAFIKNKQNLPLVFSKEYLTSLKDLNFQGTRDTGAGEISYRPVVTLSYFLDYRLWKLNAFGYHLTNLILHIINALIIFYLVNLITAKPIAGFISALLFALHPVNTEVVSAICFREDLLAFLFFTASLVFYISAQKSSGRKSKLNYLMSLGLFFPALFSKEMAVTLPLVLILYDYYFGVNKKHISVVGIKKYAGYFIILAVYFLFWGVIFKNPNPPAGYPGGNFYTNILTMTGVIADYIRWAIAPVGLHFLVTEPHLIKQHFSPEVLASFLTIAVCLATAFKMRKTAKVMSFAIAWFFVTLFPVMNIFPIKHIIGLRYLYLPIAGFCIFLALALLRITNKKAADIAVAVVFLAYSILTTARIPVWKDNISLWSEITVCYPDNHFAHYGLGEVYLKNKMLNQAIGEFKVSAKFNAKDARLYYKIGDLCAEVNKNQEAENAYKKAIELNPGYFEAYNNLAALYSQTGRTEEAISLWSKAVNIQPRFAIAHFNLSIFYFQNKQYDLAVKHADKVLACGGKIDPVYLKMLEPYRK